MFAETGLHEAFLLLFFCSSLFLVTVSLFHFISFTLQQYQDILYPQKKFATCSLEVSACKVLMKDCQQCGVGFLFLCLLFQ